MLVALGRCISNGHIYMQIKEMKQIAANDDEEKWNGFSAAFASRNQNLAYVLPFSHITNATGQ